jgi:hypothetical protein
LAIKTLQKAIKEYRGNHTPRLSKESVGGTS